MASFEVELKFPVADLESRREAIVSRFGGRILPAIRQSDCYLAHPARDFADTDEALRVRSVTTSTGDAKVMVTYKGPKLANDADATHNFKTRKEIEIVVSEQAAAADRMLDLFQALGFQPVTRVRKSRERITTHYESWPVEFALDQVEGLGSFVEIEVLTETNHMDEARHVLGEVAKQLELSNAVSTSYLQMLLDRAQQD